MPSIKINYQNDAIIYFYLAFLMEKKLLLLACAFAALAVVLGAFAAHGLQGKLPVEKLKVFETGVRYQFYHAFAIFVSVWLAQKYGHSLSLYAGLTFCIGILLFSGSLYLLSCREILSITTWKWLGPITPIGGLFFIVGWGMLFVSVLKSKL